MRTLFFLAATAVLAFLSACNKPPYELSDRELKILKVLIFNEISTAIAGGDVADSSLKGKILGETVDVTAESLQTAYERNEVAADLAYKDKTIFTVGVVKSIDRSIGENYFIGLAGGSNPFMTPKASMADGYVQYLASLSKGTQISLACKGGGMLVGSAILKDCEPFAEYVLNRTENYAEGARRVSSDASPVISLANKMLLYSMAFASLLPETSKCWSLEKTKGVCTSEVNSLAIGSSNSEAKKQAFERALSEARKKAGLPDDVLKK